MSLIQGILPPSRANWELLVKYFQYFPLVTAVQWITDWYPAGKSSLVNSRLNIPGKIGWAIMESPGPLIMAYTLYALPRSLGLDELNWANYTMAGLYIFHYVYRAWLFPYLQPSMSPIHALPFVSALAFNTVNALSIGGWLGGYGPTTAWDWAGGVYRMQVGLVIWGWSLMANAFHDDDLREVRRAAARIQKQKADKEGTAPEGVDKVYMIPKNGLFHYVLYAHYFCEWLEWTGFWIVGGWDCVPARTFLINEIATMLPRALAGKRWYIQKFGKEKVGNRKAVIPGII